MTCSASDLLAFVKCRLFDIQFIAPGSERPEMGIAT